MLRSLRPAGAWVAPRPAAHIPNPWARIGSHDNPASGFQQEGAREIFATWGYVFGRTAARGSVPKVGVSIRFWRAGEACPRKTDIV